MKIDILREYVHTLQDAPQQRSEEWLEGRKTTIGGSEIAAIMGINPFSTFKGVIELKLGIKSFWGNLATDWGTVFENSSKKIMERAAAMPILETGAVESFVKQHKFSPDGLTVINENGHEFIILLEFKSPFSRIPNGMIPEYYLPQVMAGLANIEICDYGLFVNTTFRKCAIRDWAYNNVYDTNFHTGPVLLENPVAMGITWILGPVTRRTSFGKRKSISINENDIEFCIKIASEIGQIIDFGELGIKGTGFALRQIRNFKYQAFESEVLVFEKFMSAVVPNDISEISAFFEIQKENAQKYAESHNLAIIGYLPWKAMKLDAIPVFRDETMISEIEEHLNCAINVLNLVNSAEDPKKKFKDLFSNKFDLLNYSSSNISSSDSDSDSDAIPSESPSISGSEISSADESISNSS